MHIDRSKNITNLIRQPPTKSFRNRRAVLDNALPWEQSGDIFFIHLFAPSKMAVHHVSSIEEAEENKVPGFESGNYQFRNLSNQPPRSQSLDATPITTCK